ncbi:MAG: hypothetical protein JKY25_12275 [Robiginitomaculum sp.]|nr:hypothetical protein [Robiginitomaculum sp.]
MSDANIKLTASNLAALLCARVCHDLVGPVGALENGLYLLTDEDSADMHDDALDLIKIGTEQASAKLKFLRIAFGAGGSAPAVIASAELESLSRGVYPDGKIVLDWQVAVDGLDKPAARTVLNLVMLAVATIPIGGTVVVEATQTSEVANISLKCTGPKARLEDVVTITLAGKAPEDGFDGRSIQPFYTGLIVRETGGSIKAEINGETVTFSATLPVQ